MADASDRRPHALTGLLGVFLRPYAGQVGIVIALVALQCAGNLYLPILNADIINAGVLKADVDYIWLVGGLMLGITAVSCVFGVVIMYWTARIAMAAGGDMRLAVYRRAQSLSAREFGRFGVPTLVIRTVNDVQQVQVYLQIAPSMLVSAVITMIGALVLAVRVAPGLTLLLAIALPILALVAGTGFVLLVPLTRSYRAQVDRVSQVMREQIIGVRVIRAFLRNRFEEDRFRAVNESIMSTGLRVYRISVTLFPLAAGTIDLLIVAVIWFGGRLVGEGSLPVGNLFPFLLYILQILTYLVICLLVVLLIPGTAASAERIWQVLDTVPAIAEPAHLMAPEAVTGDVEFRVVTFSYPGSERPVLNELTFALRAGQTSAIIGGTGSGKTTVINLIVRLLDATGGTVLVNGTDVRLQPTDRLRACTGLVPQSSFLFAGTVASNLRFGRPDATDEELWRALEVAQASDFVASMPGQLEAPIDQGGVNVSGGQRQRLSIARALVRRPRLYLFDDCFSALDQGTDARLRAALRAETRDAAVVIASQRVSSIMDASQIIVLEAGTVVGIGTHEQLVAECAPYQEIVASQLGEGAAV
jgi:ABC-type multidrug transport system fused ATPase/permease subunit